MRSRRDKDRTLAFAGMPLALVGTPYIIIAAYAVRSLPAATRLLACGGGASNARLMARIAERLRGIETSTTATAGIDPDWVEAAAFAWLAWRTMNRLNGNLPEVTGAREAVILGGIYPA